MSDHTIKLIEPLVIGDVTYEELELRTPNVGQMKAARKADASGREGYIASLISQIAKVPLSAVDKMSAPDFAQVADFLGASMQPPSSEPAIE